MEIAYVCTERLPVPPVKGGAVQTHIDGILPHVSRLYHVTVFCVQAEELAEVEEREGVTYVRLPAPTREQYMANVARCLAGHRFDLIHIFNRPAWVLPFAEVAPDARFMVRIHNAMFEPDKLPPSEAVACLERVSAIDTVSDYMAERIARRYPQARPKLRTIYTGVDLNRFVPIWTAQGQALRSAMRSALSLSDEPVVLFVGRLSQNKGPHMLLPAMQTVVEVFPRATLVVVGSRWFASDEKDEYIHQMEDTATGLGERVRFTGYIPAQEVERAFAAGDVFVCTSQWEEPLARVHFEAMATGLPIITTARGGNPEVVFDDVNGYVVSDYQNASAFASHILGLLSDPERRRRLGERGRRMAEARFSWYRAAAETLDLYDRVLLRGWQPADEQLAAEQDGEEGRGTGGG